MMQSNVRFIPISDDDQQWIADVDFDSLSAFIEDPQKWVEFHTKTKLPKVVSYQFEETQDDLSGLPARISGIVHIEPDEKEPRKTTVFLRVFVNRQHADFLKVDNTTRELEPELAFTTTTASLWDDVDKDYGHLYPIPMTLVYTRGSADFGSASVHMEIKVTPAQVPKLTKAILKESRGLGKWLNRHKVIERAETIQNSTSTKLLTRKKSKQEIFLVTKDIEPIVLSLGCGSGQTFTACNSDDGTFSGDPVNDDDVVIIIDRVVVKAYCVKKP